jgi:hypothetical protein
MVHLPPILSVFLNIEVLTASLDQETLRILDWISPLNFSNTQNDTFSRHHPGTGQWLLEASAFKDWLDGKNRMLWCPGLRMTSNG